MIGLSVRFRSIGLQTPLVSLVFPVPRGTVMSPYPKWKEDLAKLLCGVLLKDILILLKETLFN